MKILRFIEDDKRIRCSFCGRFISYKNLETGKATHIMVLPDSHLSCETWVGTCVRCKEKEDWERHCDIR